MQRTTRHEDSGMNRKWIALVLLTLSTNFACAASFDCGKAGTKVEKMICADPGLSKLDEELGKAYGDALKKSSDPAALKQQQRGWVKERNKCTDAACLRKSYQSRVNKLSVNVSSQTDRHSFSSEKEKLEFIRGIVRQRKFDYPTYLLPSEFCQQFLEDFVAGGKDIQIVKPDFETNDKNDPRLAKWHQCRESDPKPIDIPEYRDLGDLGGPPYRYYHIDADGNLGNGKEDVIYTKVVKGESTMGGEKHQTLFGRTGYTWVDLKACIGRGGALVDNNYLLKPFPVGMHQEYLIVNYHELNMMLELYPIGGTYHLKAASFNRKPNYNAQYCTWSSKSSKTK